jgi:hypothetical protein
MQLTIIFTLYIWYRGTPCAFLYILSANEGLSLEVEYLAHSQLITEALVVANL